jgi:hypothetical protein
MFTALSSLSGAELRTLFGALPEAVLTVRGSLVALAGFSSLSRL